MRKKLFAVIMSAMMMITFMPTMAFAVQGHATVVANSWAADFSTVTVKVEGANSAVTTYENIATVRTHVGDGIIKAIPDYSKVDGVTTSDNAAKYYYDLNTISLGGKLAPASYSTALFETGGVFAGYKDVSAEAVKAEIAKPYFVFTPPTYLSGYNAASPMAAVTFSSFVSADATIKCPAYDKSNPYSKQTKDISVKLITKKVSNKTVSLDGNSASAPVRIGTFAKKSINIAAKPVVLSEAKFKLGKQEFGKDEYVYTNYNGASQSVKMIDLPGVKVAYKLYNDEENKWEDVSTPTVKDARTYEFKAFLSDSTTTTPVEVPFYIEVKPANITVGFPSVLNLYEGDKVDAKKLAGIYATNTTSDASAVKADKTQLNAYLAEAFEEAKYDADTKTLSMEAKATKAAAEEKYASLLKNYSKTENTSLTVTYSPISENAIVACNQTKTIHVKKAKKLAKKVTFNLKNDYADFGVISYIKKSGNSKIAVSKDGVVTVKKGLKKGTYTVKIVARAHKLTSYVTDMKTLKVKVVK